MKIIGLLLIIAVFTLLFIVISKNMGIKDTAIVFVIAGILTTILELGLMFLAM